MWRSLLPLYNACNEGGGGSGDYDSSHSNWSGNNVVVLEKIALLPFSRCQEIRLHHDRVEVVIACSGQWLFLKQPTALTVG